ncbi:MAE_28990/MAE_18760 family HEPN-like nuclease [Acinetobacter junii]|uniref:MAE-28990/MAE-18760-like HEPN domain-containing protein n=1 Tax=Acinetobacter junii TaxID=40215 RepID=A0AAW5RDG7_ACIJU|nr:MAE_28990/MAE_18760 family HEPN-like nuclease [Acinetobacter junii]MCU4398360.1 hypothetical protein [Acinetobacter junii]MDH1857878.1 MAE_28990/MAE_18760 family HEPN-like nuclease [Acinetobacter junii]MDU2409007.1 MAE_28990/MAE_18760 family HEPN-like nuclease [Acinetobacter junii]
MNLNELQDFIDEELQWRKKEIERLWSSMDYFIDDDLGKLHDSIVKAIILLIYSHWEGFIKKTGKVYFHHISSLNIKTNELSDNFQSFICKYSLHSFISNSSPDKKLWKISDINNFRQDIENRINSNFSINIDLAKEKSKSIIDAQDNLNTSIFKKISTELGLHIYISYESEIDLGLIDNFSTIMKNKTFLHQVLDHTLLNCRNHIAHGNKNDQNKILEHHKLQYLRDLTYLLMNQFRDDILEFSEQQFFLKINQLKKEQYITQKEIEISNNILNLTNSYQQSNIVDISLSAAESIGIDSNIQPSIFSRIKVFFQKLNI